MGDDGGKDVHEGVGDVLVALNKQFPQFNEVLRKEYGGNARAETDIAKQYSPEIAQIQADTFDDQGRQLAATGRAITRDEQLGASQNELDIATGTGAKLAQQALDLQKVADPEYFSNRTALSDNISKLMASVDPTKLTAGEQEEIARGLGRTNNPNGSAMQTINNAMTFGSASAKKREEYGRMVDRQAAASPALRSGIDMADAASRRSVMPNTGVANYTGVQTPGVATTQNMFQSFMQPANAAMQINMQKQKSDWDKYNAGLGAVTNTIGSVGKIAGSFIGG